MDSPRQSHDRFMDNSAVNTHLQTFMSRNAPLAEEPIQQHVLTAIEMSRDESKTTIKYPKDCRGAVLMKNNTLRMSYRAPDEPRPHLQPEGGVKLNGRPSSDVTKGFERLYERSYY